LLDQIVRSHAEVTERLTKRLRELGADQRLCVSILIDHSGSLRPKVGEDGPVGGPVVAADSGAALAAAITVSLADALEDCGAATELLGFTTGEWKGGRSRVDWINAGRPRRPGRLNDLLHIVYKGVEECSVADCIPRLVHLLNPALLKENIDGEAIAWARARLVATFASDRLLVMISDGASVDDSTLYENGPSYMERHLLHVLGDIERRRDLRVVGIGIGHDVSRYIPNSVAIRSQKDFAGRGVDAVAALIVGQSQA
jgi:cobaltochelatase CobT